MVVIFVAISRKTEGKGNCLSARRASELDMNTSKLASYTYTIINQKWRIMHFIYG